MTIETKYNIGDEVWVKDDKGEEATIVQSFRGYGVRTDDKREINRIDHWKVEFIE